MKRRHRNPTVTQWALVGTAAVITAVGVGTAVRYKKRKGKGSDLPGVDDDDVPGEPTGPTVEPIPGWTVRAATDPGYPWNVPVLHYDNWPTPGMFTDIGDSGGSWKPSSGFDSFITALLGSALAMAGNDPEIAKAQGQDPNAELGKRLRGELRRLVLTADAYNDVLYGQTNANYAGGVDPGKPCAGSGSKNAPCVNGLRDPNSTPVRYMMNAEGRGLNWLPRHADILNLVAEQSMLERTTTLGGERIPHSSGQSQMLIWAPAVDLAALGPDQAEPSVVPLSWPDGVSTADAPMPIRALGINLHGAVGLDGSEELVVE